MISCRKWALIALFSCLAAGCEAEPPPPPEQPAVANIKYYLAFELSRERSEEQ